MSTEKTVVTDDTHDLITKVSERRADEFVSKAGDGGNHCHSWFKKDTGERGVEHRGACKVCDDESSSSSSNSEPERRTDYDNIRYDGGPSEPSDNGSGK